MTNGMRLYQLKSYYCNSNVIKNLMIFKKRKIVRIVQSMESPIDAILLVESKHAVLIKPAMLLGVKPSFYTTCWNE